MDTNLEQEARAWAWLLAIERLDWEKVGGKKLDNQVLINMCPGELGPNAGAPGVHVSVAHPQLRERVIGQGNSLAVAVNNVWKKMKTQGVELPEPQNTT